MTGEEKKRPNPDFAYSLGEALAEALQHDQDWMRFLKPLRATLISYAESQPGQRTAVLGEAIARMARRAVDCIRERYQREEVGKLFVLLCKDIFLTPTPGTNPVEAKMAHCMTCNILRKIFKSQQLSSVAMHKSESSSTLSRSSIPHICNSRSIANSIQPTGYDAQLFGQDPTIRNMSAEVFSKLGIVPYMKDQATPSSEDHSIAPAELSQFATELGDLAARMHHSATAVCSVPSGMDYLSGDVRAKCMRLGDWLGEEILRSTKAQTDNVGYLAGHISESLRAARRPVNDIRVMVQIIIQTAIRNVAESGQSGLLAHHGSAYAQEIFLSLLDHIYTSFASERRFSPDDKECLRQAICGIKPQIRQRFNDKQYLKRVSHLRELPTSRRSAASRAETLGLSECSHSRVENNFSARKRTGMRRRNLDINSLLEKDAAVESLVASIDAEPDPAKRADRASALIEDLTESVLRAHEPVPMECVRRATLCIDKMADIVDDSLGKGANRRQSRSHARTTWFRRMTISSNGNAEECDMLPRRHASESVIIGEWMVDMWKQAIPETGDSEHARDSYLEAYSAVGEHETSSSTDSHVPMGKARWAEQENMPEQGAGMRCPIRSNFRNTPQDRIKCSSNEETRSISGDSVSSSLLSDKSHDVPNLDACHAPQHGVPREDSDTGEPRHDDILTHNVALPRVLNDSEVVPNVTSKMKLILPALTRIEFDSGCEKAIVARPVDALHAGDEIVVVNDVVISGKNSAETELRRITSSFSVQVVRPSATPMDADASASHTMPTQTTAPIAPLLASPSAAPKPVKASFVKRFAKALRKKK